MDSERVMFDMLNGEIWVILSRIREFTSMYYNFLADPFQKELFKVWISSNIGIRNAFRESDDVHIKIVLFLLHILLLTLMKNYDMTKFSLTTGSFFFNCPILAVNCKEKSIKSLPINWTRNTFLRWIEITWWNLATVIESIMFISRDEESEMLVNFQFHRREFN